MNQETVRRSVQASVPDCFGALLDLQRWPEWRPGLRQVASMSESPVQAGGGWVETHAVGGGPQMFAARAIEVDPPRSFAYVLASDRMEARIHWHVRHHDEKTVVVQEVRARNRGLGPMLAGLASRFVDQQDAALDAFRDHLEARLRPAQAVAA